MNVIGKSKSPLEFRFDFGYIHFALPMWHLGASQVVLVVKTLTANAGDTRDTGSLPGLGRSPEGGCGNTLHILAWRATVHVVTKS